ncbi:hypothetical protein PanWU01x14_022740, partial [Parasponia andersonii]
SFLSVSPSLPPSLYFFFFSHNRLPTVFTLAAHRHMNSATKQANSYLGTTIIHQLHPRLPPLSKSNGKAPLDPFTDNYYSFSSLPKSRVACKTLRHLSLHFCFP